MKKEIILKTSKGEIPVEMDDRAGVGYVELDDDDLNKLIPTPEIPKTYLDLSMIDWGDEGLQSGNHLDDFVNILNAAGAEVTEQDILDLFEGKIPIVKGDGRAYNISVSYDVNGSDYVYFFFNDPESSGDIAVPYTMQYKKSDGEYKINEV